MCELLLLLGGALVIVLIGLILRLERHVSELQDIVVKIELGGK